MPDSITKNKSTPRGALAVLLERAAVCIFWLGVWQVASQLVNMSILLPSPYAVLLRLAGLVTGRGFWISVFNSLTRILAGFFFALVAGTLFACLSARFRFFYVLFSPLHVIIKSTPVASFTIVALIWLKSSGLSVFISFFMVLPVIYSDIYNGLKTIDVKLLEMATVFNVTRFKRLRYIYLPGLAPFLASTCGVGLGIAWKSGIAAEVIGISSRTIGESIYKSKIYLETDALFAWTAVIILLSLLMEWAFSAVLRRKED